MDEKLPLLAPRESQRQCTTRWLLLLVCSAFGLLLVLQSSHFCYKHKTPSHHKRPALRWNTCPDDKAFQCAYLEVPLNVLLRKLSSCP